MITIKLILGERRALLFARSPSTTNSTSFGERGLARSPVIYVCNVGVGGDNGL